MNELASPGIRYAWFVVGILMLAIVSSFIDRQILSLLVRPIKEIYSSPILKSVLPELITID